MTALDPQALDGDSFVFGHGLQQRDALTLANLARVIPSLPSVTPFHIDWHSPFLLQSGLFWLMSGFGARRV